MSTDDSGSESSDVLVPLPPVITPANPPSTPTEHAEHRLELFKSICDFITETSDSECLVSTARCYGSCIMVSEELDFLEAVVTISGDFVGYGPFDLDARRLALKLQEHVATTLWFHQKIQVKLEVEPLRNELSATEWWYVFCFRWPCALCPPCPLKSMCSPFTKNFGFGTSMRW